MGFGLRNMDYSGIDLLQMLSWKEVMMLMPEVFLYLQACRHALLH